MRRCGSGGTSPIAWSPASIIKAACSSSSPAISNWRTSISRSMQAAWYRWTWFWDGRTQRSQVLKQADVVALFAMLPDAYDKKVQATNFRYEPRCGHGSSLSRGLHALVARVSETSTWRNGTSTRRRLSIWPTLQELAGGVHIAALGGLWQAAIFGFAGVSCREDAITLGRTCPQRGRQ